MPKVIPSVPGGVSQIALTMTTREEKNFSLSPTTLKRQISADRIIKLCVFCRFQTSDGEVKYVQEAEELIRPERNTLLVSFTDLEGFNQELATTIQEEYYR